MPRYYDMDKLAEMAQAKADTLLPPSNIAFSSVAKWLELLPAADVAPRAEVALEVIGEVEKMARDYIDGIMLLDPQNTYCFGGINAFEHVIRFLAELKKKYTEASK